jgi:hypothetical protein
MTDGFVSALDVLHFLAGGTALGALILAPLLVSRRIRAQLRENLLEGPVTARIDYVFNLGVFVFLFGLTSYLALLLVALEVHP